MMNWKTKMSDPWSGLADGNGKRVSAGGKYDFFWVSFSRDEPGLILKLSNDIEEVTPLPKLRNIDVSYVTSKGNSLALRLKDNSQREIFEALCLNVVSSAEDANNLDAAHARFVRRTRRWHYLLQGGRAKGLTTEEQRGLVGELHFLRQLVEVIGSASAVEAWKGPLGSSKDFEFPEVCVEVKARRGAAKPFVSISSADQLTDVIGARIFLRVCDVASAIKPEGLNLHDHVTATLGLFEDDETALEAFQELMDATGYDEDDDYSDRRWLLGAERKFEVVDGFPRVSSPLHEGVERVNYAISLTACDAYKFEGDIIEVISESLNYERA